MYRTEKSGFTLIELLIVIALFALLTSLTAPRAFSTIDQFTVRVEKARIKDLELRTAYESFIRQRPCTVETKVDAETKIRQVVLSCSDRDIVKTTITIPLEVSSTYNSKGIEN